MPEERAQWGRQIEFVLTLIGYSVGLGSVWRFPYEAYRNGGGAFLIPYVICQLFLGIPVFALEVSLGQFGGQGPLTVWDINPAAKGLGMASITVLTIVMIYYNIIIAWALRFLVASFTSSLPWEDCDSCECLLFNQKYRIREGSGSLSDNLSGIVTSTEETNETLPFLDELLTNNSYGFNCSLDANATNFANVTSTSEIFFNDKVLHLTSSIEETGDIVWELLVANLVAYVIIFLVLVKGIQSLGKVVYFTVTLPFILLTVLLIRTAMLDGARDGVEYYLKPDWNRLSDGQVWSDAAVQVFFSLSTCHGGLIAMSSYDSFHNNVIRDAIVVPIINFLTSFFTGFVVFTTLGFMAYEKNTTVDEVTAEGPGLIFVVYPEALSQMPLSPLWAFLFFFMVCILGFSCQFSTSETLMTAIIDQFPHLFSSKLRRTLMRASVCLLGFLLGIPMVTGSGQYLLGLVDNAAMGYPSLLLGLLECVVIVIFYGYNNFAEDIKAMVGFRPPVYFRICWNYITPLLLVGAIGFKAYKEKGEDVDWVNLIYWLIIVFPISIMPLWWFYYVCTKSQLTTYTPIWRARRDKGDPEDNHVMEIIVPDPIHRDSEDSPFPDPSLDPNSNSLGLSAVNNDYVYHQEEIAITKM